MATRQSFSFTGLLSKIHNYDFYLIGVVYFNFLPMYPKEKVEKLSVDELLKDVKSVFDKGMEDYPKNLDYKNHEKCYGQFLFYLFIFFLAVYKMVRLFI